MSPKGENKTDKGVRQLRARKAINLMAAQEVLRAKVRASNQITDIKVAIEKLNALQNELTSDQINRLRIVIDAKFKLLAKCLPDLRSAELTVKSPDGTGVTVNIMQYQQAAAQQLGETYEHNNTE